MWNFGDLALDIIERNRALGLDEYGRTTFDSFDEEEIPPIVEQPIFPVPPPKITTLSLIFSNT